MGQAMIETVRGPVPADELGVTMAHEHLHVLTDGVQTAFPRVYDRDAIVAAGVQRVRDVEALGARSMIDLTVIGLGRDIALTRAVAAEVDMHIVVATGAYYFDQLPGYFRGRPVEHLAEQFVLDITEGIAGTTSKAAILKCPTDAPGLTADNEKLLRAVAIAHRETGTPISTHTHAALQRGRDQVRVFREEGVDLTRTVIGHCGDTDDFDYLFEIADTGAFLGMDRFGINFTATTEQRVATIVELVKRGYLDRIALSHDCMCWSDMFPSPEARAEVVKGHDFLHISGHVIPALLEAGITRGEVDRMFIDNPRRHFEAAAQRFAARS